MNGWMLFFTIVAASAAPIGLATLLLTKASERRALEVRDVVWARELTDEGWKFKHSGSVAVSEVKIVFTIDGVTSVTRASEVRPDAPVLAANPEHERTLSIVNADHERYEREIAEIKEAQERTVPGTPAWVSQIQSLADFAHVEPAIHRVPIRADMNVIITWRYPSGMPDTQEVSWVEVY